MTTTSTVPARQAGAAATTSRAWLGVLSLALGAAVIVTTEFIPVGFLPDVAADLDVSLGVAGAMVLVPGLSAAVAAPLVTVGARRLDRRALILGLSALVVVSNAWPRWLPASRSS
jgi:predicted MFS family arabinose efflux permease